MGKGGKYLVLFILLVSASGILWIWRTQQNNEQARWKTVKETPGAQIVSLTEPVILISDPILGPQDAMFTVVEFADFRCPHCAGTADDLKQLMKNNPEKIRLVWKDFPSIPPREASVKAHTAARCAQMQGKFWEYHDDLFNNQSTLTDAQLISSAENIGLNMIDFKACVKGETTKQFVERSFAEGQNLGVDGTPTLYVNGKKWEKSITEIDSIIK